MKVVDAFGRRINYLRLSVTDRCNLRCQYCMPSSGIKMLPHSHMLTYEELLRVAQSSVSLGVEKIRITGGEPLVRRGLVGFLERLAKTPGLRELVLTTNGVLLPEMARPLREAGVQRLNISLDSLKPEVFAGVTRGGDVNRVLKGIEAAEQAGFPPVKINVVAMRGVNDGEILDFAALTVEKGYTVRFIEYMPSLRDEGWEAQSISGTEILERIQTKYTVVPVVGCNMSGPARNFRIAGAAGGLGIITAVSGHFCSSCNRIRVTSSGRVKGCLFSSETLDLKPYLRCGDEDGLRETLRKVMMQKPMGHHLGEEQPGYDAFAMSQVGG